MEKKFTFMEQKDSIESLENKIKDINVLQKKIVP
jgi:hypothetical protein